MRPLLLISLALSIFAADSVPNRAPLQPAAFQTLRLTSVKPKGWLLNELKLQAAGLSGHLDEFWPDLGPNSGWLGGGGESWERGPYFLDGLVPLGYLTTIPTSSLKPTAGLIGHSNTKHQKAGSAPPRIRTGGPTSSCSRC